MKRLITFEPPLEQVTFLGREKRFFSLVRHADGTETKVHIANSGSMKSCMVLGAPAFIRDSQNPERKLRHSLELIRFEDGYACLNTARANELSAKVLAERPNDCEGIELLNADIPAQFIVRSEVRLNAHTRFDFALPDGWIEVKSVSLRLDDKVLAFPDAVTERGQKHLRELIDQAQNGKKSFLWFMVMRASERPILEIATNFRPASEIDPSYGELIKAALQYGVEIRLLVADISPKGLSVRGYFKWPFGDSWNTST
jgi:sugar fermentation stimulation protein A